MKNDRFPACNFFLWREALPDCESIKWKQKDKLRDADSYLGCLAATACPRVWRAGWRAGGCGETECDRNWGCSPNPPLRNLKQTNKKKLEKLKWWQSDILKIALTALPVLEVPPGVAHWTAEFFEITLFVFDLMSVVGWKVCLRKRSQHVAVLHLLQQFLKWNSLTEHTRCRQAARVRPERDIERLSENFNLNPSGF